MDLFTYLMAKKGHNTHRDLFSYLLGKNAGGSGTYTTFSGTSLNISNTLQAKIKNIALEGNTSQDGTPTPDTPIPIKVVTGEQNVTIQNKNILNAEMVKKINSKNTITTYQNVQCIKLWGQSGTIGTGIKYKENTSYSFVFNYVGTTMGTKNDIGSLYFVYTDGTQNLLTYFTGTTAKGIRRYTSNPNKTLKTIRWNAWAPSQAIYLATNELQLVEGSEQYNLIQHQEQNYPLSLGNRELARINNYKDYIFKNEVGSPYYNADLDLNGWYLHKKINKVVFDGTETGWTYYTGGGTYKRLELNINDIIQYTSRGIVLANYFKYLGTDIINEPGNIFSLNKKIYLYPETSISSVNEWKNWLLTHKTEVYYPLENSTNTKITDTTLLSQLENINNNARSYKDTTIIECSSASTDNETIGFSGDIKVTSVGLGNSLNTSLLSSNLQNEEPLSLDNTNEDEIEEPIENEEVS